MAKKSGATKKAKASVKVGGSGKNTIPPKIQYWETDGGKMNYRLKVFHAGDVDVLYGTVQGFERIAGVKKNVDAVRTALNNPQLVWEKISGRRNVK